MSIERPELCELDWVLIGSTEAVVRRFYSDGTVEVVYDPVKPTTRPIDWNGERWIFRVIRDFGGVAKDSEPSVVKLRSGWHRELPPWQYT